MRLFAAIGLPDGIKARIALVQNGLPQEIRRTPAGQMHITLQFIGKADAGEVAGISKACQNAAEKAAPFTCEISGVGAFPKMGVPRVVLVGADGAEKLARAVNDELSLVGFAPDKPYSGHITIGRAGFGEKVAGLEEFLCAHSDDESGTFGVDGFSIYKSILSPQGAEHIVLSEFSLGGGKFNNNGEV